MIPLTTARTPAVITPCLFATRGFTPTRAGVGPYGPALALAPLHPRCPQRLGRLNKKRPRPSNMRDKGAHLCGTTLVAPVGPLDCSVTGTPGGAYCLKRGFGPQLTGDLRPAHACPTFTKRGLSEGGTGVLVLLIALTRLYYREKFCLSTVFSPKWSKRSPRPGARGSLRIRRRGTPWAGRCRRPGSCRPPRGRRNGR